MGDDGVVQQDHRSGGGNKRGDARYTENTEAEGCPDGSDNVVVREMIPGIWSEQPGEWSCPTVNWDEGDLVKHVKEKDLEFIWGIVSLSLGILIYQSNEVFFLIEV